MTRAAGVAHGAGASTLAASIKEYERLRSHVLTGSTVRRPAGLVVLLRHGLAAWRTRRTTCCPSSCPVPRTPSPGVVSEAHAGLVPVLVDMVLGANQEVVV